MDLSLHPISYVYLLAAAILAVGCLLLARKRASQIDAMSVPSLRELVRELRRMPLDQRAPELLRRAEEGTWEQRLAHEIADAPEGAARVAVANDVLFDLDHEIDVGKTWATAAVRIAVAGTGLLGLAAYLTHGGPIALAGALFIGFVGGVTSFWAGERGKERAASRREAFDSLVSALLPEEASATRAARARRRDRV